MKISLEWLREYATLDAPVEDLVQALVDTGTEVDRIEHAAEGAIVARVLELTAIAESTRGVRLADIDAGDGETVRLVTGAPNVQVGDLVAYGPPGTVLPGSRRSARDAVDVRRQVQLAGDAALRSRARNRRRCRRPADPRARDGPARPSMRSSPSTWCSTWRSPPTGRTASATSASPGSWPPPSATPLREPPTDVPEGLLSATASGQRARVRIEDPAGCRRFTALVIEGVAVGESPHWLQRRLRAIGLRPDQQRRGRHQLRHPRAGPSPPRLRPRPPRRRSRRRASGRPSRCGVPVPARASSASTA